MSSAVHSSSPFFLISLLPSTHLIFPRAPVQIYVSHTLSAVRVWETVTTRRQETHTHKHMYTHTHTAAQKNTDKTKSTDLMDHRSSSRELGCIRLPLFLCLVSQWRSPVCLDVLI